MTQEHAAPALDREPVPAPGLYAKAMGFLRTLALALLPEPVPLAQRVLFNEIVGNSLGAIDGILVHRHLYLLELLCRARTGEPLLGDAFSAGLTGMRLHPVARLTTFGARCQPVSWDGRRHERANAEFDWYWPRFGSFTSGQMIGLFHDLGIGDAGRLREIAPLTPQKIAADVETIRRELRHILPHMETRR